MTPDPDPDTADDHDEDATNRGESAKAPAEGGDDLPPEQPGSPKG